MKKIIAVSLVAFTTALSLGASSTEAKGWYVGAGAAWKSASYKGSLTTVNEAAGRAFQIPYTGSGDLSGSDFFGTLFTGHTFEQANFNWFVQLNGAMDARKQASKEVNLPGSNAITSAKIAVERVGSAGFDLGIGKEFKGVNVSLKAGILVGRFNMKVQDLSVGGNFASTSSVYAPGFAPGVGVAKKFGSFDVGFNYEYQMYSQIKYNGFNTITDESAMVKANPRYHVLALTVKKEF